LAEIGRSGSGDPRLLLVRNRPVRAAIRLL
jgi:hypothetical protein